MSSKPDHAKAKSFAEFVISGYDPSGEYDLAKAYLDLVKQHGELRAALEFYGDEENWDGAEFIPWDNEQPPSANEYGYEEDADKHNGAKARETLARIGSLDGL